MTRDDLPSFPPCAEALLAGTVAAMTAWADPSLRCTMAPDVQRAVLARKLVANLGLLLQHPALGAELRQVMAMAHQRWLGVLAGHTSPAQPAPPAPERGPGARQPTPVLH
jgi:hypothetical protein